ncbi:MAG: hypothetical protein MUE76_00150 [Syntrophales bacterium]|jgi:cathepsin L|nr:hypothetical protein [Syntrophales bacterium]
MKRSWNAFVLTVVLLALGGVHNASEGQQGAPEARKYITPREIPIDYVKREQQAPALIREKLAVLRRGIAVNKRRFTVGYTAALDFDLKVIAGLTVPPNLSEHVKEQNRLAANYLAKLWAPPPCSANAESFDWRVAFGATPVKDQGPCGSCWAFASHGAFEGSWRLVNHEIVNSSEQDTLDCSGKASCEGGWWVFPYLVDRGSATESDYRYRHAKKSCRQDVARPYRAEMWGYVESVDVSKRSHVDALKKALCRFGPLAVTVNATDAFHAYTGGVFDEFAPGEVNHGVTLIGWDDNRQSWLIKNSWGAGWGDTGGYGKERGYMWIAYGSNKVGAYAAWVAAHPSRPAGAEPYEAAVFEHPNYAGKSLTYEIRPGMCQRIEPEIGKARMNDKLTSVRVGSGVGAMLFEHRNYAGPHLLLGESRNDLRPHYINDRVSSLIVYPRSLSGPIGVWLIGAKSEFYPVGEACRRADYPRLVYSDNASKLYISGPMEVTVYEHPDFKGASAVFTAGDKGSHFDLPGNLSRKVSSLRVKWVGGARPVR